MWDKYQGCFWWCFDFCFSLSVLVFLFPSLLSLYLFAHDPEQNTNWCLRGHAFHLTGSHTRRTVVPKTCQCSVIIYSFQICQNLLTTWFLLLAVSKCPSFPLKRLKTIPITFHLGTLERFNQKVPVCEDTFHKWEARVEDWVREQWSFISAGGSEWKVERNSQMVKGKNTAQERLLDSPSWLFFFFF